MDDTRSAIVASRRMDEHTEAIMTLEEEIKELQAEIAEMQEEVKDEKGVRHRKSHRYFLNIRF